MRFKDAMARVGAVFADALEPRGYVRKGPDWVRKDSETFRGVSLYSRPFRSEIYLELGVSFLSIGEPIPSPPRAQACKHRLRWEQVKGNASATASGFSFDSREPDEQAVDEMVRTMGAEFSRYGVSVVDSMGSVDDYVEYLLGGVFAFCWDDALGIARSAKQPELSRKCFDVVGERIERSRQSGADPLRLFFTGLQFLTVAEELGEAPSSAQLENLDWMLRATIRKFGPSPDTVEFGRLLRS